MTSVTSFKKVFFRELSVYSMYSFCAVILSASIAFSYLNAVLYFYRIYYTLLNRNYVMIVVVSITLLNIVMNQKINFKYRNLVIKGSQENPLIVYFMCLPLLILSFVGIILIFLKIAISNNTESTIYLLLKAALVFGVLILFGGMMVLLISNNGTTDTGENWILSCSNFLTIALCLIYLVIQLCYGVALMSISGFSMVSDRFRGIGLSLPSNDTVNETIEYFFTKTVGLIMVYFRGCFILLSLALGSYFIEPLRRNILHLENHLNYVIIDTENDTGGQNHQPFSMGDIVFNVTVAAILITPLAIYKRDSLMFDAIITIQITLMIFATFYSLMDIQFWVHVPRNGDINVFNEIILWLGIVCDVLVAIARICGEILVADSPNTESVMVARIFQGVIQCIEAFLQAILIECIIRRHFKKPKICSKKICKLFNPLTHLAVLNFVFLLSSMIYSYNGTEGKHEIWSFNFVTGITALSYPMTLLYRCFCTTVLVQAIM